MEGAAMQNPSGRRRRFTLTCGLCLLTLAVTLAAGPAARAQAPARPASLDEVLKALSTYDGGIESAAVWKLRDYVEARKADPAGRAECEAKLLQFLKTPATPVAKMAACRQLRIIASDAAVPALQAMLPDEGLADMALYVLQQIPGAAADSALGQALPKAAGPTKIAIISALGQRKAASAVPALATLLTQPEFAGPAAVALGTIGGDAAAEALVRSFAGAQADLRATVAASMMKCAETFLAARNEGAALRLYETLLADGSLPVPLKRAAAVGRLSAAGTSAVAILMTQLGGSDAVLQEAAIARIKDVIKP